MYSVEQEKVCDSVNDVDCNIIYEKKCEEGKVSYYDLHWNLLSFRFFTALYFFIFIWQRMNEN